MNKHIFLFFALFIVSTLSKSQCSTCPATPPCSGGNGAVYNNANINSGQTYWYNGSGDTYNINFGGGTLIVCGDLTISNLNFNGASTIYIAPGGSLTINSNLFLNGGASIYNSGTLIINNNVTMQNSNNNFINCSLTSSLTITGTLSINSSTSYFSNNGIASISNITLQGGASNLMCLGQFSETYLNNITNNFTNSVTAPSGTACVSYSGNALLNNDLTADSDVIICQQTGATTSGGATFGNATVNNNCTSCSAALPVELLHFDAQPENESVKLLWTTATEINNDYFLILRSKDGINFESIGSVPGAGNSTSVINYTFYDKQPYQGISYYRLKQVDFNGQYSYSPTIVVYLAPLSILNIYPNPASEVITVLIGTSKQTTIKAIVYNSIGQPVIETTQTISAGEHTIRLDIKDLPAGEYVFKVITRENEITEKEFLKK